MTNESTSIPTDDKARIIMLVFGKMEEGSGSYWCYVAIKPSEYKHFTASYEAGHMNLYHFEDQGFGEIIVSGQGKTPPPEVTYQVARMYKIELDELFKETDPTQALTNKLQALQPPAGTS